VVRGPFVQVLSDPKLDEATVPTDKHQAVGAE